MSTATDSAAPAKKRGSGLFQGLQKVGRSLQLPIAVLPAIEAADQQDGLGKMREARRCRIETAGGGQCHAGMLVVRQAGERRTDGRGLQDQGGREGRKPVDQEPVAIALIDRELVLYARDR